uniref:Uncharacterized protein n=1 Tax=Salmonella enteritidis TaxID=149539 RepID=A0A0K1L9C1_SALEN|nr:hypothetical protein [Salmonella enterica subsp. enterica serovar Enteritidis]
MPAIRPAVRCPGALFRYPVTSLICLLVSLFVSLFVYNISIPFMRRLTDASGDIRTRTDY